MIVGLVTVTLALAAAGAPSNGAVVRVRASEAAAPCLLAAAAAYTKAPVEVETGSVRDALSSDADVLVASGVEITRAVEAGVAAEGETDIARIPWVLALAADGPTPRGLADLPADLDVVILGGPAAYEARRALASHPSDRVKETTDAAALRDAPVALTPLSLAGRGRRVAVEVPPIVVRAAVAVRTAHPDAAQAFVRYLGSPAGQRAFATCNSAERR